MTHARTMSDELPQRTPGTTDIPDAPHFQTSTPSVALLIRVAEGLDQWAECGRHIGRSKSV